MCVSLTHVPIVVNATTLEIRLSIVHAQRDGWVTHVHQVRGFKKLKMVTASGILGQSKLDVASKSAEHKCKENPVASTPMSML